MLIKKKPVNGTPLTFPQFGAKPASKQPAEKPENEKTEPKSADSAKSEAKEAAAENKKPIKKTKSKSAVFAQKAAVALAKKG